MKALVISGGGSKGAFAGGVAQHLIQEEKKNYDLFIGTSTGGLMITHLSLGKDTPIGRSVESRPGRDAEVVALPKVGGLHHRYEWRDAA